MLDGQAASGTKDCDGHTGDAIESSEISPMMKNVESMVSKLYHSFYRCHGQTMVFRRGYLKLKGFSGMNFQNEKLLDPIGLKILSVLQEDARMPLRLIGKKVGLSAPAVSERMRKLEENGIIKGYHARIAPEAVGRSVSAFINLTTDPQNYMAVKTLAAGMHQITSCHHISGDASFIMHIQVEDLPALARTGHVNYPK
jgi:Lrp/AsnC family leucine-responsive transcriptional regulator